MRFSQSIQCLYFVEKHKACKINTVKYVEIRISDPLFVS